MRLIFLLLLFIKCIVASQQPSDPYVVLGVNRNASPRDIKQAYKRLAKEWHPDKNRSPGASDKFMEIIQAYEILTDPAKKERYDRYGSYDSPSYGEQHHGHGFEDIFNYAFGGFGGDRSTSSSFEKHRITYRMYANSLLDKSYTQPFIIYAYSTYCHVCFVLEPIWRDAISDLEALGYGVGTVNYLTDGNLLEKLRVSYLPAICVLVEGRVIHYRGAINALSAKSIRMFARDAIPSTFLHRLNNYNALRRFLDQWESTNKPSVLIVGASEEPRLRYSLLAMKFAHFSRFAYVNGASPAAEIREMRAALGVNCFDCENLFIFNENPEIGPVAKLIAEKRQFTTEEMAALINKHKLLRLTRISSMAVFDELCPVSSRSLKHLCVILPVLSGAEDAALIRNLRKFVDVYGEQLARDRVRVATIFVDQQRDFIAEFKEPKPAFADDDDDTKRNVLVIWRYEYVAAKFAWLPHIWTADAETMHKCFEELKSQIYVLARGNIMSSTAKIDNLIDEYAPSWFTRTSRRVVRVLEMIWYHATKEEILPILSISGTLLFIFLIGYGLNYFMHDNQQGFKAQRFENSSSSSASTSTTEPKEWHPEDPKIPSANTKTNFSKPENEKIGKTKAETTKLRIWREMEPMIHELRAETYFGLIRLLKPGCRSIIILVDEDSKHTLLQKFARCIYSLRNNKTFSFGYLMVNKNLAFFRALLEHTLPNTDGVENVNKATTSALNNEETSGLTKSRLKAINPKQTLGTVLVICGWKLYFSIYHPSHMAAKTKNSDLDSSSEAETNADSAKHTQKELKLESNLENVLNRFPTFLDRLIEGSIRRYYIPEWPKNLK